MMALSRIKPALEMRKPVSVKMAMYKTLLLAVLIVNRQTKSLLGLTHAQVKHCAETKQRQQSD